MTSISPAPPQGNSNIERNIRINFDDEQVELDVLQLTSPEFCDELQTRIGNATRIIVEPVSNLLTMPEELLSNLLDILSMSQHVRYRPQIAIGEPVELLDAVLALQIDTVEMGANFQRLAQRAAAILQPELDSHYATEIANAMTRARITPLPRNQIAAGIRRQRAPQQQSGDQVTPQSAAELVIQDIQDLAHSDELRRVSCPSVWYFQGNFGTWQQDHWELEQQFDLKVTRILQRRLPNHNLTTNFINSTIKNIKAKVFLNGNIPLPCRIERPDAEPEQVQVIQVENGMIDLSSPTTLAVTNADPFIFGAPRLPVEYDEQSNCPRWLRTLGEIFPAVNEGDHRIRFLQEFFGYCLRPWDCRQEMFVVFVGGGANGKSVVLEVLGAMLGTENVSHLNLEHFQGEFRLVNMEYKLCNISSDMQRMPKVQEGLLKQLVSGERVQVNIKHQAPRTMKPTAKLIFATNHLPQFSDTSDGIWRRMTVVPFLETIPEERRDRGLARRIADEELNGLFNWAAEGLRRLISQGSFTVCQTCDEALGTHRHDSDPVAQFLDECCVFEESSEVLVDTLYLAYSGFVLSSGRRPVGKSVLGRRLASLNIEKDRYGTGRRARFYRGLALRDGVLGSNDTRLSQSYQPPQEHERHRNALPGIRPAIPQASRNGNTPS